MLNFRSCESKLVIVLIFSVTAAAQERVDIGSNGNGAVSGRVLCADTQKPARFAEVRLTPIQGGGNVPASTRGSGQTSTLVDGSFLVDNVAPGDYVVTARTPGYIDAERLLTLSSDRAAFKPPSDTLGSMVTGVRVSPGQASTVVVTIYRGAVLSGTVSYDDGSPALGVSVAALHAKPNTQAAGVAGIGSSNDRGAFRIAGLSQGAYIVQVRPMGSSWTKPFPVYYGNTLLKANAKLIAVKAGEERDGLDLQIPASTLRQVSGVVQSSSGHGVAHAFITMTLTGTGEDGMNAATLPDGSFRFQNVPDGKFTLRASGAPGGGSVQGSSNGDGSSLSALSRDIEVNGSDVDNVVFNLPATAAIPADIGISP